MDSEEVDAFNASLSWLDDASFDADSMPLESMDVATFSGDVVPRNGIQRPILIGGDGTRPHAPRAAREKPVHVTHIHQTIIQSTMPVAQVHVATPSEGTSGLTCLERALSARPGSIYKPTSKWRHRTKAQVESGVPHHAQNGTLSFGTLLPPQDLQPPSAMRSGPTGDAHHSYPSQFAQREPLSCTPVHTSHSKCWRG